MKKTSLVGQLQIPGQKPVNVQFVSDRSKREYDHVTVTTTAYTLFEKDYVLVDDDTAGGAVTITLPPAIENTDRLVYIKKLGTTGNVIIDGNASEEIDGTTTKTMTTQYDSRTILCDGSGWHIL
jgi:hypothetical protein